MSADQDAARLAQALTLLHDTTLARDGRAALADLAATLDAHGFTDPDRDAVLASGARLGVYRALVRQNLGNTVFRLLPRTRALVNAAYDDAFDDDFVAFLESPGPRAPFLRDVVLEAAAALDQAWTARPDMAAWTRELLALETARFAADVAEGPAPITDVPALDASLRLGLAAGAARFAFTHDVCAAIDAEETSLALPAPRRLHIAVSRDGDDVVHTTEIAPRTFVVTSALAAGLTLAEALAEAGPATTPEGDASLAHDLAALAAAGFFTAR